MLAPEDGLLEWVDERPVLFLQMMSPVWRGLFLGGIGQARTGGGPLYQEQGYLLARAAAFEAHDALGVKARLESLPLVRLARQPWMERFSGRQIVAPADKRSHGIGRQRRGLKQLHQLLDAAGARGLEPQPAARAEAPQLRAA
jgi:hypothetical protein